MTAGSLRKDVDRRLVSPTMPAVDTPGRGNFALWSPMAVRRAFYMARLRKHGVNGRVLPLLLFLRDGWGWDQVRNTVVAAAQRNWEAELKARNKPSRVHSFDDLMDNAAQTDHLLDSGAVPLEMIPALVDARQFRFGMASDGEAPPGASPISYFLWLRELLYAALGGESPPSGIDIPLGQMEQRVRAASISAKDLPELIEHADRTDIEAARHRLHATLHDVRVILTQAAAVGVIPSGPTNPLTMCTREPAEVRAQITGRVADRDVLALFFGSMIVQSVIDRAADILAPAKRVVATSNKE